MCEQETAAIEKLEKEKKELQNKNNRLELEKKILLDSYSFRKYLWLEKVGYMCPIESFKMKKNDIGLSGPIIYILSDENGKKYVGQSNRDNFDRILDHFNGKEKDLVSNAYNNGTKFFVEKIIYGWKTGSGYEIFNLNDAETYFIHYFNTYEPNGYNQTMGNHQADTILREKHRKAEVTVENLKTTDEGKALICEYVKEGLTSKETAASILCITEDELVELAAGYGVILS